MPAAASSTGALLQSSTISIRISEAVTAHPVGVLAERPLLGALSVSHGCWVLSRADSN